MKSFDLGSKGVQRNTLTVKRVPGERKICIRFAHNPPVLAVLQECLYDVKYDPKYGWVTPASPVQFWRVDRFTSAVKGLFDEVEVSEGARELAAEIEEEYEAAKGWVITGGSEKGPDGLFGFQRKVVDYAVEKGKVLITASMGLGKTLMALKTVEERGSYPCVVVCPASVKWQWKDEIVKWTGVDEEEVQVLSGRKAHALDPAKFYVLNYDILDAWVGKFAVMEVEAVVFDEVHMIKNPEAKRSHVARLLAEEKGTVIALSGTPLINHPIELLHPLMVLDAAELWGGKWGFVNHHCPPREFEVRRGNKKVKVQDFKANVRNLGVLHDMLKWSVMARVNREDVLKDLPPLTRTPYPVEITNRREYDKADREFVEWLKDKLASKNLTPAEIDSKLKSSMSGGLRVQIGALKRVAAKGKIKATVEVVSNAVEEGEQVIVFTVHKEDVAYDLLEKLKEVGKGAVIVTGDQDEHARVDAFKKFQDGEASIIIGTLGAMSEGVTLTNASTVVFAEMGWTPKDHEQAEARAYARLNDLHGLQAVYMVGKGTIDEYVMRRVSEKKAIFDQVMDGKVGEENDFETMKNMIKEMVAER